MRWLLVLAACGGGSAKPPEAPKPAVNPCAPAYAEYEARWREARTQELTELSFGTDEIDEMISIEVTSLMTRDDLAKLRAQYTVLEVFVPDAPWPRAFAATEAAITACGEGAPKP